MEISWGNLAEWITAIATLGIAGGISLTIRQLRLTIKDLEQRARETSMWHERSKREKAISLMGEWAKNTNRRSEAARKFAETLSFDQTIALVNQEDFDVDQAHRGLIDSALDEPAPSPGTGGKIRLSIELVSELRWQVATYLNNLEVIFSAWRHDVADKTIILEQFRSLVATTQKKFVLETFREVMGEREHYPAIEQFVRFIKENPVEPRPAVG